MITILQGDWIERLRPLPDKSVHCCVTSPPYWGLRDYGVAGQLGLEKTPEEFVSKLVEGFREVRRVLREDGTLWLNLGDSYACTPSGRFNGGGDCLAGRDLSAHAAGSKRNKLTDSGLKPKDLCGIPWMAAFALRADGWYLRSEITWCKKSAMPESTTDRPSSATEKFFLFSKSKSYFYDQFACRQPYSEATLPQIGQEYNGHATKDFFENGVQNASDTKRRIIASLERNGGANLRNYWLLGPEPFSEAHFATFPTEIPRRAILLGTSAKGCCPKCGAGWERVVEKSGGTTGKSWHDHSNDMEDGNSRIDFGSLASAGKEPYKIETLGWQPGCDCVARESFLNPTEPLLKPVPATVLDPFGGSGTTGQVAIELGRKAILIELNPKYISLIEKRTHVTPGLPLA